ncbi:hypothetical protein HK405_009126, partial [Cladochytrium tenue]
GYMVQGRAEYSHESYNPRRTYVDERAVQARSQAEYAAYPSGYATDRRYSDGRISATDGQLRAAYGPPDQSNGGNQYPGPYQGREYDAALQARAVSVPRPNSQQLRQQGTGRWSSRSWVDPTQQLTPTSASALGDPAVPHPAANAIGSTFAERPDTQTMATGGGNDIDMAETNMADEQQTKMTATRGPQEKETSAAATVDVSPTATPTSPTSSSLMAVDAGPASGDELLLEEEDDDELGDELGDNSDDDEAALAAANIPDKHLRRRMQNRLACRRLRRRRARELADLRRGVEQLSASKRDLKERYRAHELERVAWVSREKGYLRRIEELSALVGSPGPAAAAAAMAAAAVAAAAVAAASAAEDRGGVAAM